MILPVIMSGGNGSRLWPLSRKAHPKQFLPLVGEQTMLQETILRLEGLDCQQPTVICNEGHRFIVAEQLAEIDKLGGEIILEPQGRNTAPAIALAAFDAVQKQQDPYLLVLAADHVIRNVDVFQAAVSKALICAKQGTSSLLVSSQISQKLATVISIPATLSMTPIAFMSENL